MNLQPETQDLAQFRGYLSVLARMGLDSRLNAKLDASDVVQQTLLEACQDEHQFRGHTDAERAAWLRQILSRNLSNAVRDLTCGKRDVAKERSLEQALEDSSDRLESWLVAEQSSPSQHARRDEQVLRLTNALAGLSAAQSEALILRHLENRSLAEIAQKMDRTPAAVAGLLHRGLEELRAKLADEDVQSH